MPTPASCSADKRSRRKIHDDRDDHHRDERVEDHAVGRRRVVEAEVGERVVRADADSAQEQHRLPVPAQHRPVAAHVRQRERREDRSAKSQRKNVIAIGGISGARPRPSIQLHAQKSGESDSSNQGEARRHAHVTRTWPAIVRGRTFIPDAYDLRRRRRLRDRGQPGSDTGPTPASVSDPYPTLSRMPTAPPVAATGVGTAAMNALRTPPPRLLRHRSRSLPGCPRSSLRCPTPATRPRCRRSRAPPMRSRSRNSAIA